MGLFDGVSWSTPLGQDSSDIFGGPNSFFRKPFGSKPDAPAPPPPPPDPAQATSDALQAQLNNELNMRRSNALATGGQGVPDEPVVKSAGQLLMGN